MTDFKENGSPGTAEAVVTRKKTFSIIWVVPLVALIIGGILAVKTIREKGPVITISFKTAEGLVAGKTKVKYKDVEVGEVQEILFSDDLSHVLVKTEMRPEGEKFLTEETRFWVVTARVSAGEVSGLGTLFSGAYIGMEPGRKGTKTRRFEGLETPPILTAGQPGGQFSLMSDRLGSLSVGAPVYFKQIKVGQVTEYNLDPDSDMINFKVFINAPHHERVQKNTRFWNASGVNFTANAQGIKVDTESLVTVLEGGIAFETPASLQEGGPPAEDQVFHLYPDRESTREQTYTQKIYYLLHFSESVRGLAPGAPVEFRGIKVGEVADIKLQFDQEKMVFHIPVLIFIEPERIRIMGEQVFDPKTRLQVMVRKGLRAQLKTGNLLTGSSIVEMDFHPEAQPAEIAVTDGYPEIPTIPPPFGEIAQSLSRILKKIEKLPLEEISRGLQQTVVKLNSNLDESQKMLGGLNREILPELKVAIREIESTMEDLTAAYGADSKIQYEVGNTLTELGRAARAARVLADYLERHPEALITGKGGPKK